jgi:dipeptidase E
VRRVRRLALLVRLRSDGLPPRRQALQGLGFLPHSNAVHYEEESNRRPAYHAALLEGQLPGGYGASDGAALHFVGEDLHRVVLSRPEARAYRVEAVGDEVVELPLEATYLGDRPKITLAAA